ncbi:MAG TPA: hypothetical protein VGC27_06765 [Rhizomicrobium sp.]
MRKTYLGLLSALLLCPAALGASDPLVSDRSHESVYAARDALYVLAHDGDRSRLSRIPSGTDAAQDVPLPYEERIAEISSDPRVAGITLVLESAAMPPRKFAYIPRTSKFVHLKFGVRVGHEKAARFVELKRSARPDF